MSPKPCYLNIIDSYHIQKGIFRSDEMCYRKMKLDRVIAVRNNKTIYRDGDRCVKVFNAGYSKADVLNEALNQARMEDMGINVPKLLEVTVIDGKWAIVSEFIQGVTLAQLISENPDKKEEYINYLIDLQIGLHSKTCSQMNKLKDNLRRKIATTDFDATTRYDLHNRLGDMPRHNKVCHGDFNPSNVIITEDGTPYIIDWSHAARGNASADAAQTYLLFWLNGDISGAQIYLDNFCEKSKISKQYVQLWMPIVAAAQSAKGNEKEREFLMSWVNDARHE